MANNSTYKDYNDDGNENSNNRIVFENMGAKHQLQVSDGFLIGGVDEAGRGSVIGPLVVAGVSVRESKIAKLTEIGVRDSKLLTPKSRAILFGQIVDIAESISIIKADPVEVDDSVFLRGLNKLEARAMARVINNIGADEVYVDSCDINPERYGEYIQHYLLCKPKLYSMHHADTLNVVVSAASIIAKITRDHEIQEIRRLHRDIGSGYPSDRKTMYFIKKWISSNGYAPDFARKSWKPLKILLEQKTQKRLV